MSEMEPAPEHPYSFLDRVWPYPWMGDFLEALSLMPVVTLACRSAGIGRARVYECRENEEFKEAWDEALLRAPDMIEATVIRWSTAGIPIKETRTKTVDGVVVETVVTESVALSPALAKHVINRWKPEYRDSFRHEHTGADGGPIQHDHELTEVNRWPTAERAMELARLAQEFGIQPRETPLVIEQEAVEEDDGLA